MRDLTDQGGAGYEPDDQEDIAEEGEGPGALPLRCIALPLLLHGVLTFRLEIIQ